MKVLFPLYLFYPSRIGGPANTLYWLCKALAKNDVDVVVVATREGIEKGSVVLDKWTIIDGISTRYCDSVSKFSFKVVYYSLKTISSVNVVVFSSICFLPNFIIAIYAVLLRKKVIWSPRGELFDSALRGSALKTFYFRVLHTLLGRHIIFHATSSAEKMVVEKFFPKTEVVCIPNYIELPDKQEIVREHTDFIFVGRIAPIKALDKLIAGLAKSRKFLSSNSIFRIIGGVEKQFENYYKSLLKQIEQLGLEDKVVFLGSKTGQEKFQEYAQARFSFLVSDSENFGNVVVEALSQGTPVVASKGTPWESLDKVRAGFWIDNSPNSIANIVDRILDQPEKEYLNYRDNALSYSKAFDVFEHVEDWKLLFNQTNNV